MGDSDGIERRKCRPPERSFVLASPTGEGDREAVEGALRRAARNTARTFRVPPPSGEVSRLAVTEGASRAPFDIIAAFRRGNFDILPLRAIRDALALLARERGKEKRLSLFSSRSCATYRMIPGRDHISKAPKREVLFGAYIELHGSARNISSARHARIGSAARRMIPCCFLLLVNLHSFFSVCLFSMPIL